MFLLSEEEFFNEGKFFNGADELSKERDKIVSTLHLEKDSNITYISKNLDVSKILSKLNPMGYIRKDGGKDSDSAVLFKKINDKIGMKLVLKTKQTGEKTKIVLVKFRASK